MDLSEDDMEVLEGWDYRQMYSEYNPEDKIYFKKFSKKKFRAKSQDRRTTGNTGSKHKKS